MATKKKKGKAKIAFRYKTISTTVEEAMAEFSNCPYLPPDFGAEIGNEIKKLKVLIEYDCAPEGGEVSDSEQMDEQLDKFNDFLATAHKVFTGKLPSQKTIDRYPTSIEKLLECKDGDSLLSFVCRTIKSTAHPLFPSRNFAWAVSIMRDRFEFSAEQLRWLNFSIESLENNGMIYPLLKDIFVLAKLGAEGDSPEDEETLMQTELS